MNVGDNMRIVIKEINDFMPDTTITINDDKIEVDENKKYRVLKYNKNEIQEIVKRFLVILKRWNLKYVSEEVVDDGIYTITIEDKTKKTYYIKNKYPYNWESFIWLRNNIVREEFKVE